MGDTCRDCELYTQGVCVISREKRDPMSEACSEFKLVDVFDIGKDECMTE